MRMAPQAPARTSAPLDWLAARASSSMSRFAWPPVDSGPLRVLDVLVDLCFGEAPHQLAPFDGVDLDQRVDRGAARLQAPLDRRAIWIARHSSSIVIGFTGSRASTRDMAQAGGGSVRRAASERLSSIVHPSFCHYRY